MADCALVTGGSRNIGQAICERLSADGHVVVQFDVLAPENPSAAEFVKVDLSNEEDTAAAESPEASTEEDATEEEKKEE